ncbi:diguanylate cyclase domain-containing protein [Methylobacterium oryzae CBMB20]
MLDLDHFKVINDTMGHPAGDRLLQLVADRLRGIGPISGSVARLGGDEFVIVQQSVTSPAVAEDLAQRVLQELERPFDIDGHQVTVGASIGIAIAPSHANDEDRLLKCADIALYAIKGAGRSGYKIFQHEMEAATRARHALESDLRAALANGELELHYQPIVDLEFRDGGELRGPASVAASCLRIHSSFGIHPRGRGHGADRPTR